MMRWPYLAGLVLALVGCEVELTEIDVELVPEGEAELLPPPPPPAPRPPVRMNLDQLERALVTVSGGVRWEAQFRGHLRSRYDLVHLGRTLGKADYVLRTADDLSPGVVFQKFLDDAGRFTCGRMIERDGQVLAGEAVDPPLDAPILLRHVDPARSAAEQPDAVDRNLTFLLERFHSRFVAADDPALASWRTLVGELEAAGADGPTTWRAVCVALVAHGDFYLF